MGIMRSLTINGEKYDVVPVIPATSVTLLASAWVGDGDAYSQQVEIADVTPCTKVDLLPTPQQLEEFHYKTLAFVAENEGGRVTVYSIGDKPAGDHTMQVTLTEVERADRVRGNTVGTTMPRPDWDEEDPTHAAFIRNKESARKYVDDRTLIAEDPNRDGNIVLRYGAVINGGGGTGTGTGGTGGNGSETETNGILYEWDDNIEYTEKVTSPTEGLASSVVKISNDAPDPSYFVGKTLFMALINPSGTPTEQSMVITEEMIRTQGVTGGYLVADGIMVVTADETDSFVNTTLTKGIWCADDYLDDAPVKITKIQVLMPEVATYNTRVASSHTMDLQSIVFPGLDGIYNIAPGGYGLGKTTNELFQVSTPGQVDQLVNAGWYEYYNETITCCGYPGTQYGGILVVPSMWSMTQFFFCRAFYGSYLKRIRNDGGAWEPWEWVNPPMLIGVEYRTTERSEGLPVYTKLIPCGKVTAGGTITVNVSLGTKVIRSEAHNGWVALPYYTGDPTWQLVAKAVTPNEIVIEAGTSHTDVDVWVRAWYLK